MAPSQKTILPTFLNFVSIGKWNKMLFTGSWVSTNLFGLSKGTNFDALVSPDELSFIFINKKIKVIPKEGVFEIRIDEFDDDLKSEIKYANTIATKLFLLLPHTPVVASGFNIKYHIDSHMHGSYLDSLRENIKRIPTIAGLRFTDKKEGHTLNTLVDVSESKDGSFDIMFNFHYDQRQNILNHSFNNNFDLTQKMVNN